MSLRVENLSVAVGNFLVEVPSLEVPRGEWHCVMGKSGSGKSTLLNAIAGFLPLREGRIFSDEIDVTSLAPERRRMAMVFQRSSLFGHLDIVDNVGFALRVQGVSKEKRELAAKEWLRKVEIEHLAARRPHELSEGEGQRVALARALIAGFSVVLMDEPFSALDVVTRRRLRALVGKLVKETNVSALMVTHQPEDALEVSDRILLMDDGHVVAKGTPRELEQNQDPRVKSLLGTS